MPAENVPAVITQWIPLLSGGLMGAIITFSLNRWVARREKLRLEVKKTMVEYTLPTGHGLSKGLSVSYEGKTFKNLYYAEIEAENISKKRISNLRSAHLRFIISEFPAAGNFSDRRPSLCQAGSESGVATARARS